jgi:hypothetical protein
MSSCALNFSLVGGIEEVPLTFRFCASETALPRTQIPGIPSRQISYAIPRP